MAKFIELRRVKSDSFFVNPDHVIRIDIGVPQDSGTSNVITSDGETEQVEGTPSEIAQKLQK